ncbi:MAG: SLC13 family permease [Anaerolineales bacterium]|nr:SLC13 family permease [Anaerolineales bacterium]
MPPAIWLLLLIIAGATALFLSEKLRPDLVALLVMLSLGVSGLLTAREAFSGLSNPSVILIIAVFIVTGALFRTGVSAVIGHWLVRAAGRSAARLTALVVLAAGTLSLFMNNIASAAVIMPAVMDATQRTRLSPSKILLPMAFATQLGGMATLLTTANIVTSGVLVSLGLPGLGLFDFLSVGGPAALAGLAYLALAAGRMLPARLTAADLEAPDAAPTPLAERYQLHERLQAARVLPGSPLVGRPLAQTGLRAELGANVIGIQRREQLRLSPAPRERLQAGDLLLLETRDLAPAGLQALGLAPAPSEDWGSRLAAGDVGLVEVLVGPRSAYLGRTLREIQFRSKFNLSVVALLQGDRIYRAAAAEVPLRGGEALLVHGSRAGLDLLRLDPDWIVLSLSPRDERRPKKLWLALGLLVATLAASVVSSWPVGAVFLVGALAMVLTGCLTMDEAYAAVEWRSVFLVAGMLPVGLALAKTGAAELLGQNLVGLLGQQGPLAAAAGFFIVTATLNQFIPGGSAVPVVLTPIAVSAARGLGADPRAFAVVIAVATGASLLTPFAHPVNVLVMGPGGYTARDYMRFGLPAVALTFVVVLVCLHFFWGV